MKWKKGQKASKLRKFGQNKLLRSEDLIIYESLTQDLGFTAALEKQAHSRLRNCFSSAVVEPIDKLGFGYDYILAPLPVSTKITSLFEAGLFFAPNLF